MNKGKDYIGVGVGAVVINSENEVLLLLRKKDPERGCWSIPGGTVEYGESVEEALIRELEEELSIEVEIVGLLRVTNHILKEGPTHWVSPAFLVRHISGSPCNMEPDYHEDMRWYPIHSLPSNITMTASLALKSYLDKVNQNTKVGV